MRVSAERTLNKLARTYGGEQTVTVRHVSVNDDAQAIVGMSQRGEGDKKR